MKIRNQNINIHPFLEFIERDADANQVAEELNKAYCLFAELAMSNSEHTSEPIYQDSITAMYWIKNVKEVFEKMTEA